MTTSDLPHAEWSTSSHSTNGGNCVEVAGLPGAVAVRDSKDRGAGAHVVRSAAFRSFVRAVKDGRL